MALTHRLLFWCVVLALAGVACNAARFTDPFSTDPSAIGRKPFMWEISPPIAGAATSWDIVDGALEYRTENSQLAPARTTMWAAGVDISDESTWSCEVAFRHIAGIAPIPQYEAVVYILWHTDNAGDVRLLSLVYDAGKRNLILLNGDRKEKPIPADLTGDFHPVRITVQEHRVRVYIDGKLRGGPYELSSLKWEGPEVFILGPITRTENHTIRCQWDYFAFTDEGAFAPSDDAEWNPAAETEPVTAVTAPPHENVTPADAFDHPPYPKIKVLGRKPGSDLFNQALPEEVLLWRKFAATKPNQMEAPFYHYEGETGPVRQNVYRGVFPLKYDDRRCVAVFHMTRGIGDTVFGFMDYKLWYCVSTDGGHTYDEERPLIQRGEGFSATHPVEYVWIGKNSFVFATLQPFMLKMSNGQIFLPCYYAPLDENGEYYNPRNTSTYSWVFGLIGTWNKAGDDVLWDVTEPLTLTPEQSTSGLSECAVIELDKPGHIFMVIRAGNEGDQTGTVPCFKWKTLSTDYGKTWSKLTPFTFSDGTRFWSPTAESNFVRSSVTGKVYWIGNIARVRPRGGWPRYPLVIAELDEEKLGLRKETVTVIDDRGPRDSSDLQLSNFSFLEDPRTGHILVMLNRLRGGPGASGPHTYEIEVRR